MTSNRRSEIEHHEVSALIPWYVNETIGERDRRRVDVHVNGCVPCRDDLAVQRRLCEAIEAQPALDYMPVASLKRLHARLDALQAEAASNSAPPAAAPMHGATRWRGWMAASIAVMAVAVALLGADRWAQFESRHAQPNYHTVTNSVSRPPGEVIRAVFSPTVTLVELQTMLDEAQLRIVSGPTEAGVYSLASNATLPVSASLALLRQHSTVRFAERTLPEPDSGNSR
ncbi:MAG TPA: zf-HC2 domain-containing protein [Steroidobacteraceae bacterium]|nr:zf-HC2 domain-containing protein [Steroidobacteraceae bacterium]